MTGFKPMSYEKVEVLAGPERRRRRSLEEKLAMVQETYEPGKTVSLVAQQHGVNPNQLFRWRKLHREGSLAAVQAGEEVVPASQFAAALKEIQALQRLLGKKTMEVEILREAVEFGRGKKVDCAHALVTGGQRMKPVCDVLGVARSALFVRSARSPGWQDGRSVRCGDDTSLVEEIKNTIAGLPTYGYRRTWAMIRRQRELEGRPPVNHKAVYRLMRLHCLLLPKGRSPRPPSRRHEGRVAVGQSDQRWCSDGFEFHCDNGEPVRTTFALDCCDREAIGWTAGTASYSGDDVRDVMLEAVEQRFGVHLPAPIQWLSDNGSPYTAGDTRAFARDLKLEPLTTPICSPQSNGMAESFVKTMKNDYIAMMPKPDARTAIQHLAEAFEHYNEYRPHSALKYRSPREFRRLRGSSI
ncbi:TPA: IS3 family transposase [Pseudomonas aeruginosa]